MRTVSTGSIWISVFIVTALALGCTAAFLTHGVSSLVQQESRFLEARIQSSLALMENAPKTARDALNQHQQSPMLIDEPRPQLAMATLQGIVRDEVEALGGAVASTNAANGLSAPWGATVRLDTEFEAPIGSVIDILKALEAGQPKVIAERISLNSRERADGSGRQRQLVVARVTFSAFTTAKVDQP